MVKAYLRYEQIQAFGVIASSTAPVVPLPNPSNLPLLATAAVDAVAVWNLRTGQTTAYLGNIATRKAGYITSLTASSQGTIIAAGYSDGTIRLWRYQPKTINNAFDDEEPVPLYTMNAHRSGISALAFDDDAALLVSGSNDGDVILWNVTDGTGRFRVPAHNDAVTAVLLANRKDGMVIISASKDALLKVFDITTQHCLQTVVGHHAEIWAMAYHPSQQLILTGTVDAEIRGFILVTDHHPNEHNVTGLGPSERVLKSIGTVQRSLAAHRVTSIVFSQLDDIVFAIVAGLDKSVDIFRVRSAQSAQKRSKKRIKQKAAEDEEHPPKDAEKQQPPNFTEKQAPLEEPKPELRDYLISLRNLRLKTKPHLVTCLPKGMTLTRDKSTGPELLLLVQSRNNSVEVHGAALKDARSEEDGRKKGKRPRSGVGVVKLDEVKKHMTLDKEGHRKAPRCIVFSRDGNTLLSTGDGHVNVWNVASRTCVRSMDYSGYGLSAVLLGADARHGVVGSKGGELSVFDLKTGNVVFEEADAHDGEIWSMCLDGETYDANTLITGGADKRVRFWDLGDVYAQDGKLQLQKTMEHANEVLCVRVAYERDRPVLLVSLTDNTVRAYMMDTLQPYLSFYGHRLPVLSMDVSSDGLLLATGSADKTLKLWGLDFGDCRRSLRAHTESVRSVVFQPKTHYVFTGSRDGEVKYWDGDKFEMICSLEGQKSGEVWTVATSSDGEIIASGSDDKLIRVWRRTDEPMFLEEERDERMDAMFERGLLEDDDKAARVARVHGISVVGEAGTETERVGRRTLDAVKGGEGLIEALRICKEEAEREDDERIRQPNPLLLGLSPDKYVLRAIERIQTGSLEDALELLPLDGAMEIVRYCSRLLTSGGVSTEVLVKTSLYLVRTHHGQIIGGALGREEVVTLWEGMKDGLKGVRNGFGNALGGLEFWKGEIEDRDDRGFREARATLA